MIVQQPIPTTLIDCEGEIYGYLDSTGRAQLKADSNVGHYVPVWDDVLKKKVPMLVVWDGAAPACEGFGRGELLAHPADLPKIHRKLGGPRYKMNASWGPRIIEVATSFDGEEQE